MREKRSMTPADFEAVRPLLRISEDRVNAARMALVDGQTLAGVATHFGWTRQAVGDAARVVWETLQKLQDVDEARTAHGKKPPKQGEPLPAGWVEVTLRAPKNLAAKWRREAAEAQAVVAVAAAAGGKPGAKRVAGRVAAR